MAVATALKAGIKVEFENEKDWLDFRRTKVTASEAAIACGLHPHVSAYELWARKTGRIDDIEQTDEMECGHDFEPVIAARFMRKTGIAIYDPGAYTMWESPKYPFVAATPDRLYRRDHVAEPLECKAVFHNHYEWQDGDCPIAHRFQLQTQIHCLSAGKGVIAAQLGAKLEIREFDAHPALFLAMAPHIEYFLDCVRLNREPKESFVLESARKAWRIVHAADSGETIELDAAEWGGVVDSWEREKETARAAEKRAEGLKFRIERAMDTATFATVGSRELSYKAQSRRGYCTVDIALKDELDAAGIEYKSTDCSTYRVLRAKKEKG